MRTASWALALCLTAGAMAQGAGVDPFVHAIGYLKGVPVQAVNFPNTIDGFESYLRACGVVDFTARDLTRPNHPEIAKRLGYTWFVPPQDWWNRGASLALVAQEIQRTIKQKVTIRNWWRPEDYNRQPGVDGARGSDHITATAMDLDYATAVGRAKAESLLRSLQARAPWLQMSLGVGPQTTHVGLNSPRGHREWHYAGYKRISV